MDKDITIPGVCRHAAESLRDAELGRLIRAVMQYQVTGREPELCGNERILWPEFKAAEDERKAEEVMLRLMNSEKGKKGGRPKKAEKAAAFYPPSSPLESPINPPVSPEKEKPPKGGKKKERFLPPTVDEVRAYCLERNNSVDPVAFVDYYATNGWTRGKNRIPIADWKACVRTWEHNGYGPAPLAPEQEKPKQRRFVGTKVNEFGEEVNVYEYV